MTQYYFLATALPPLQIGVPPEISFEEFDHLLRENLTAKDMQKVKVIRRYYDIMNIRALWRGQPFDLHGNLNEMELEAALVEHQGLPEYIYAILDRYDRQESQLHNFPALTSAYYANEIKGFNGFLKKYLNFEHEWRLVLAGFRAKLLGRYLPDELQFEDPNNDIVAQILAQKDAKGFVPPDGYEELQALFELHMQSPLELYQALCEYRFYKVQEMIGVDAFSIEYILGYLVQLIIIEEWMALDKKKGLEILDKTMQASV